ncbi:zinc finger protein 502-like [Alosa sapidissima]|uniref:zinc finger protein 502-like n=1 Tax=Alosa sapidissima TaxID=34773 RepID=UPI001C0810E3|nr:zinc finger protein 502-like [Alosa sapidissima]XP_041962861.1 zinc finger protein 502-like [Alosa sapidissima]
MDADLANLEQMVMKGEEVTSTDPAEARLEEPYRAIVIPQPPPVIQPYQHESLQCFQCFITFCNSKAKERHMKKSHREEYKQQLQQCDTLFTCYVCDRTFSSSEELTQHQSTHNKEDKPFKCTCKESFRTFSELTSHRRQVCPERQFLCKDCGVTCRSPALLRNHRLAVHSARTDVEDPGDAAKFHRCAKCNAGFTNESELLQHQENHAGSEHCNGGPSPKRPRGRPPKTDSAAAGGVEKQQVKRKKKDEAATADGGKEEAKQAKPRKKKAEAEEGITEAGDETETGAVGTEASTPATAKADSGGARRGRPPKSAPSVKAEEKKPVLRKAHPCGECEESFARPEQLQAHVTRVHTAGRHACPTCGKSFGRESNLKAHQQSHTKDEEEEEKKKPAGRGKR